MSTVLVLYYSAYGHIEKMAEAVAEGALAVPGTEVTIKRVPELVPEEIAKKSGMKLDQPAHRDSGRARELRRHHLWNAHSLRQHVRSDAQFP